MWLLIRFTDLRLNINAKPVMEAVMKIINISTH